MSRPDLGSVTEKGAEKYRVTRKGSLAADSLVVEELRMGHHLYSALGRVNPAWAAKPLFQSQKRKLLEGKDIPGETERTKPSGTGRNRGRRKTWSNIPNEKLFFFRKKKRTLCHRNKCSTK